MRRNKKAEVQTKIPCTGVGMTKNHTTAGGMVAQKPAYTRLVIN